MAKLLGVVPNLPYTQFESTNLRGYPAVHGVIEFNTSKTLCGKNPDTWDMTGWNSINCKRCLHYLIKEYGSDWKDKI